MALKNPLVWQAVTVCFAMAFTCDLGFSQSTNEFKPPPNQYSPTGQRDSQANNGGDGHQDLPVTLPSTRTSISDQEQSIGNKKQTETDKEGGDGETRKHRGVEPIDAVNIVSTILITVFTGVLAVFTIRQTKLMDQQTQALDNQTALMASQDRLIKNTERAFVFVKPGRWIARPQAITRNIFWSLSMVWENFGNTTATDLRLYTGYAVANQALPDEFEFPADSDPISLGPLGPRITVSTIDILIPGEILQEARVGTKHVYIWGWAKYGDILDASETHVTKFCYRIAVVSGDPRKDWADGDRENLALTFPAHKHHNEAN
jgi:hypothetical protein